MSLVHAVPMLFGGRSSLLDGLLAYWKLDGNGDDSVGAAHATPSGTSYGSGKLGQGVVFPDVWAYVDTPVSNQLGDFTAAAWFLCTGTASYQRVFDKSYDTDFWIGREGSAPARWGGGVLEASPPYGIFADFNPNGQWNHVVSIRRGSTHELWANGVLGASNTVSTALLSTQRFAIGAWSQSNSNKNPAQYFQAGTIDEVGIWSRALTVAELGDLYNAGAGRTHPFS